MTVAADYQCEFNGLALGDGTSYDLVSVQGMGIPAVRTGDQPLSRKHGVHPGDDFLSGRGITLVVEVDASTIADLNTKLAAFDLAFRPGLAESSFVFQFPGVGSGGVRRVAARSRRVAKPIGIEYVWGKLPTLTVQMYCTDPRIYNDTQDSFTTTILVASGGLTFPATPPLVFTGTSSGGVITATNDGNFDTPMVFTIDGPLDDPRLENVTTGKIWGADISIATGDQLVVDTGARTVLLNGTANRYHLLTSDSEWWDLAPGANELLFRGQTGGTGAIIGTFRDAWIA